MTYVVDSPLWAWWFEDEHEERRASIEVHLEALEDDDMDYEAQVPLQVVVKEEDA
jgi:hypothetical protein